MPPIDPRGLLNQARKLASKPAFVFSGDSPPDATIVRFHNALPEPGSDDFRRAVSASYYALFHALTLACAAQVAPGSPGPPSRQLTRAIGHRDVRAVADWVSGSKPPEFAEAAVVRLRTDDAARQISQAFQSLQDGRLEADYDHNVLFRQPDALRHIGVAREALDLVRRAAFATSPAGRLFLGLIALRARGGGG